jgi:hypothetical protein
VSTKVAQCTRCHASPLSAQEIQGGWLCQTCSDPLVATTLASIDRVLAEEPPGSVRAIACRSLTGVSLDEFQRASERLRAEERKAGALGISTKVHGLAIAMRPSRVGQIPTEVLYPATVPYLTTLRDRTLAAEERLGAVRWLRLNGYDSLDGIRGECDRVRDEIAAARLAAAGGLPERIGGDDGPTRAECVEKFGTVKEFVARPTTRHEVAESIAELEARLRRDLDLPMPPDTLSGVLRRQADIVRDFESIKFSDPTVALPLRSDGFSQAAVDAAKAVLLAPVAKRGGR